MIKADRGWRKDPHRVWQNPNIIKSRPNIVHLALRLIWHIRIDPAELTKPAGKFHAPPPFLGFLFRESGLQVPPASSQLLPAPSEGLHTPCHQAGQSTFAWDLVHESLPPRWCSSAVWEWESPPPHSYYSTSALPPVHGHLSTPPPITTSPTPFCRQVHSLPQAREECKGSDQWFSLA